MSNPFSPDLLWQLADEFGTPLWAYDAATIRQRIADLKAWVYSSNEKLNF